MRNTHLLAKAELHHALNTSQRVKGLIQGGIVSVERVERLVVYLDHVDPSLGEKFARLPHGFKYLIDMGGLVLRGYPDVDDLIDAKTRQLNAILTKCNFRLLLNSRRYGSVLDGVVVWQDWLGALRYDALVFCHFGRDVQALEADIRHTTSAALTEELLVLGMRVPENIRLAVGDDAITEILSQQEALSQLSPEQSLLIDELIAESVGMNFLFPDQEAVAEDRKEMELLVSECSDLQSLASMVLNSEGLKRLTE